MSCIFCSIASGEIPSKKLYEDSEIVAFEDINPEAPIHILIIPKIHIGSLREAEKSDAALFGRMLLVAKELAYRLMIAESGYRIVLNTGTQAGQTVDHLHLHLLGGRAMRWPPG